MYKVWCANRRVDEQAYEMNHFLWGKTRFYAPQRSNVEIKISPNYHVECPIFSGNPLNHDLERSFALWKEFKISDKFWSMSADMDQNLSLIL